jgi:hypothetical protein
MMADKITIEFDNRDEVAMLYTASLFITNGQTLTPGEPPTPAMTAQLKLAEALGEAVPEAALQDFERQLSSARDAAVRRAAQFESVRVHKAHAARARQPGRPEGS